MANFIQKLISKWQVVVYMTLVFGAVAFFVSTLIPPKYRSDIQLLIVQNNRGTTLSFEGANYLSDVFIQVAHTDTFMKDALNAPFDINKKFSEDPKKRKNEWKSELKIVKSDDTGIISISVFDVSKANGEKIAGAVGWNFLENGKKYFGDTENVSVKIIDGPITTSSPAYPNVFVAAVLGALSGFFASVVLVFFYDSFDLTAGKRKKSSRDMIEDQIKKQLAERKNKSQLNYEELPVDFYRVAKKTKTGGIGIEERPKETDEELMSSVFAPIDEKQNPEKTGLKKVDIEKKQDEKDEDEIISMPRESFLSKLYKKSLFADKDFSSREEELFELDKEKQDKIDNASGGGVESFEQVKKVVSASEEDEAELRLWNSGGAKAPAPKNLPIFLDQDPVADELLKQERQAENKVQEEELEEESQVGEIEQLDFAQTKEAEDNPSEQETLEKKVQTQPAEVEQQQAAEQDEEIDEEREPNDEEIKERLNKLLKGEL